MAIQWEKCTNWNIGTYMSNQTIRINLIVHCMSNQIFSYRNISASMSANPLVKEIQASRNKIVQFKYSSESHEHRYSLFYFLIMLFTPVFHKALGRSRRCGHIVPPALKLVYFCFSPSSGWDLGNIFSSRYTKVEWFPTEIVTDRLCRKPSCALLFIFKWKREKLQNIDQWRTLTLKLENL